jgi:hypothetical protein
MAIFKVENVKTWYVFGNYEATDEKHALDVYAQDAGYRDFAHICEEVPVEEGEIVATRQSDTIKSAGFIVHDNGAIWGAGVTEDLAWENMVEEMGKAGIAVVDDYSDDELTRSDETLASHFRIQAASSALIAEVEKHGGDTRWHVVAGVAVTKSEYDAS